MNTRLARSTADQPHAWCADLTQLLQKVIIGQSAGQLITDLREVSPISTELVALAILPTWCYAPSRIEMGRKGRAREGGQLRFPVRVRYTAPPVQVHQVGPGATVEWAMSGLGHHEEGTLQITTARPGEAPADGPDGAALEHPPASVAAQLMPRAQVTTALRAMVEAGNEAQWRIVTEMLSPLVKEAVLRAEAGQAAALRVPRLLDETAREQVSSKMLYGAPDAPTSYALTLVDRMTRPAAFERCDPLRMVSIDVIRAAREAVQSAIGDPRRGPQIRAFAAQYRTEHPAADLDEIVAAYGAAYPSHHLAKERAWAALTAGADVMARIQSLEAMQER